MDTKWQALLSKLAAGKSSLLRFTNSGKKKALSVVATPAETASSLNCVCDKEQLEYRLTNRPASLTHTTEKGYLLISGFVTSLHLSDVPSLKFIVMQASLFERKGSGQNEWLEEVGTFSA